MITLASTNWRTLAAFMPCVPCGLDHAARVKTALPIAKTQVRKTPSVLGNLGHRGAQRVENTWGLGKAATLGNAQWAMRNAMGQTHLASPVGHEMEFLG